MINSERVCGENVADGLNGGMIVFQDICLTPMPNRRRSTQRMTATGSDIPGDVLRHLRPIDSDQHVDFIGCLDPRQSNSRFLAARKVVQRVLLISRILSEIALREFDQMTVALIADRRQLRRPISSTVCRMAADKVRHLATLKTAVSL